LVEHKAANLMGGFREGNPSAKAIPATIKKKSVKTKDKILIICTSLYF
jgi:hypothetical protein